MREAPTPPLIVVTEDWSLRGWIDWHLLNDKWAAKRRWKRRPMKR